MTRIDAALLGAIIDHPDEDVLPDSRIKPHSLIQQLVALDVGENASRAIQVDTDHTVGEFSIVGTSDRDRLRNSVGSSVAQARRKTDYSFTVEVSTLVTTANRLYHVAIVTRTE